nr:hypothetical protein [Tanacetum cinerariifolium]
MKAQRQLEHIVVHRSQGGED